MPDNAEETPHDPSEAKDAEAAPTPDLEKEKLKLEVRLLASQLSWRGFALELLKSGTVLVALIGVAVTLWVGFRQAGQAEQSRIAERFDKALTRLASEKSNERMTGVSSLRLFLNEPDETLRAQALNFLVDAASVESDALVQAAILKVFADLKKSDVSQADLNALLKAVIERNRSLANSIRSEWPERVRQDKKQKLASFARLNLKLDQIPNEIPLRLIAQLTLEEYLEFLETERGRFERLEPAREIPLNGVSQLLTTLLKLGAKANDFSGIACQWCNFSVTRDLAGTNFEKANLEHANFSRVNLKDASFKEANLSDTIFFAADLSNANLKDNTLEVNASDTTQGLPMFDCANLKGADLSGTPLLYYAEDFVAYRASSHRELVIAPRMISSQIDQTTNLEYFTIVEVTTVTDDYLIKNPADARFAQLLKREATSEDLVFQYVLTPCKYRRFRANFKQDSFDETAFSSTTCIQLAKVDSKRISSIRPELWSTLSGLLGQPAQTQIPLLVAFNGAMHPSTQGKFWLAGLAYECDDGIPPDANMLKIKRDLRQ